MTESFATFTASSKFYFINFYNDNLSIIIDKNETQKINNQIRKYIEFYSNKIAINNKFETSIKGLYSIGDGGGLTRGLMMASASGVQTARNIIK